MGHKVVHKDVIVYEGQPSGGQRRVVGGYMAGHTMSSERMPGKGAFRRHRLGLFVKRVCKRAAVVFDLLVGVQSHQLM